jgi:hypothetical protein
LSLPAALVLLLAAEPVAPVRIAHGGIPRYSHLVEGNGPSALIHGRHRKHR